MNQISAKLAELLLGSGDHTGNLGPLVGQRRHDVTFRHIHPRSQNDRGDYLLQADMMSAMRLVFMRHDTGNSFSYLGVGNVYRGRLQLSTVKQFELVEGELEKYRLNPADILVVDTAV